MNGAHMLALVCFLQASRVSSKSASSIFDEPMCSKFHFEEQVLEKLVRLEFSTEQSSKREQDELSVLRTEVSDLKKELATLKSDHSQLSILRTEVSDLKKELETLKSNHSQDVSEVATKRELKEVEVKMNELVQRSGTSKGVAFVARNPPTSLPNKDVIPFSTTVLNSGDGYDSSTGRFTAPVSGTYLFSTQLCSVNDVRFQLVVNNSVLGVSRQYDTVDDGVCSSMVTVATMNSGEQAWVKGIISGAQVVADATNKHWNMFTGVLITQTSD